MKTALDAYERNARLTPGLYAILPVAWTITSLGLHRFPILAGLAGLLSAAGGAWLLSSFVGDVGRAAQAKLFESWGGAPATKLLRLREPADNAVQRDAWRAAITTLTGIALLDAAAESANPGRADEHIAAAIDQVRFLGQGGERGVQAVQNENVAFGYQRNLYGFRWIGRGMAAVAVAVQLIVAYGISHPPNPAGLVVCAALGALWVLLPSQRRTRQAGERYARQLLIAVTNQTRRTP